MRFLYGLSLVAAVFFLPACSGKQHVPVESKEPIVATVNIKDMSVTFVDVNARESIGEWKMSKPYTGGLFLPDGDTMMLYGKNVKSVDLFSLTTGSKITSWKTGSGIVNAKLLKESSLVVFADQERHAVRFFNLKGNETANIDVESNPLSMSESERLGLLFVMSFDAGKLEMIDLGKMEKTNEFSIHPSATGALIREAEEEIWIGGHGKGAEVETHIHIYHLETGELKKKVSAPSMPVHFLERDRSIFSLSHGTNTLFKMDGLGEKMDSVQIGANPFEMAWINDSLIVAGYDSNDLHFVDPDSLSVTKKVQVGNGPFKIISREWSYNE